jgi:hypothetical protein
MMTVIGDLRKMRNDIVLCFKIYVDTFTEVNHEMSNSEWLVFQPRFEGGTS